MGSNSVNIGDRVTFFAFCNFPYGPLSLYQVSLNYLNTFRDMLWTKCDGWLDGRSEVATICFGEHRSRKCHVAYIRKMLQMKDKIIYIS